MKVVVLGAGVAGATVAHLLKRGGCDVTVLEREDYVGGGVRTFFYAGHPYTNGPRLYYGYSEKVFKWMNSFVPIRRFPFELRTLANEPDEATRQFWTYPPHELDFEHYPRAAAVKAELAVRDNSKEPRDFNEYYLQKIGPTLYDMFTDGYSKKMWMIDDNRIFDIFKWSAKDRPIESGTREAYKGSYIGYPVPTDGYNSYFAKMLEGVEVVHGNAKVVNLKDGPVRVFSASRAVAFDADLVVSSIPIDELCGFSLGELPYSGRDFFQILLPCKQVFPGDVRFCHYAGKEPWTRITEFKKITYFESENTLLVLERPSRANKLYPYLTKANTALVDRYLALLPKNVYSIGRLGTYKYSTIEQTIVQAFACAAKILGTTSPEGIESEWKEIGDVSLIAKDRKGTT